MREGFVNVDEKPGKGQLRWGFPKGAEPKLFDPPRIEDDVEKEMFPEEVEAFRELKTKHSKLCSCFTDRFVASALLQWYLDVDQAVLVLERNLEFKKKFGLWHGSRYPRLEECNTSFLNFAYGVPGGRSKSGQYIMFGKIREFEYPPGFTLQDAYWASIYMCMTAMEAERLDACRMGVMMIVDLDGMGWKHFNAEFEKAASEIYQDTFPMRWGMMGMVNPPFIVKAILPIMRVFLKKKIMDRIQTVEPLQVFDLIDRKFIPKKMGGDLDWSAEMYQDYLSRWEEGYWYHRKEPLLQLSKPSGYHPGVLHDGRFTCCGVVGREEREREREEEREREGEEKVNHCSCLSCGRHVVEKKEKERVLWGCVCVDSDGKKWRD
eukprot:CAMPEP_0201479386 /NCGR_PEP_ID=MMETSP0151_2-20130828/4091_1 /ASSEMBLY_ACC=CAM_ASM_000257 /TAXON_ID=200890 /ORGANISM="Paramoeba atlantica, Strain 621/1 / CCAP 1560/9" /LENGTH=376 /DNA_ID=CAMNT_0047860859 /DNA_START=209 /DNA_END=1339 /DNA_ORIENTATION=+